MTFSIKEFIEIQEKMLQSQLDVLHHYQQRGTSFLQKNKRTSNLDIVESILKNSGQPLHISKIIEIAKNDYHVNLERDSIVSALIKKIHAEKTFVRVAPNTFWLKIISDSI
jgi:hypothetical protein